VGLLQGSLNQVLGVAAVAGQQVREAHERPPLLFDEGPEPVVRRYV
jgi:hypothetical protein